MCKVKSLEILLVLLLCATRSDSQWQRTSGPMTHRQLYVTALFGSGDTIFAACSYSGVFVSTNNGLRWREASDGLPSTGRDYTQLFGILNRGNTLFASTEDGIYKSPDLGSHWSSSSAGLPARLPGGYIDVSGTIFVGGDFGVYQSNDNGTLWAPDTIGLPRSINGAITPIRGIASLGMTRFVGTFNGAYRSSSFGSAWQEANNGMQGGFVNCFLISGQNIFAGMDYGYGIYLSTNLGQNWTQVTTGLPANGGLIPAVKSLAEHGGVLFAGIADAGVYRSTNYGTSWFEANQGLPTHFYPTAMAVSQATVFTGTSEGLFGSTDNGTTWASLFSVYPTIMTSNAIVAINSRVFASATCGRAYCDSSATYLSTDQGTSWPFANTPFTSVRRFLQRGNEHFACAGYFVYLSTDDGDTWLLRNQGLLAAVPVNDMTYRDSILLLTTGMYLGGGFYGGVYISSNSGETWIASGLTNKNLKAATTSGNYNLVSESYSIGGRKMYRSPDYGQTWEEASVGVPSDVGVNTFLSIGVNTYAGSTNGVYLSTNYGTTWEQTNTGLDLPISISSFAKYDSTLIVGTTRGVYSTQNGGAIWRPQNLGFADSIAVSSLTSDGTFLYAGTQNGVWRRALSEMTDVAGKRPLPAQFALSQNYPNPFNPSTTIRYGLPHSSFVLLTVYNTLGQQVARLVNEQQQIGYHDVVFRGDGLASGVYFYRLDAGSFTSVKRLLLLK